MNNVLSNSSRFFSISHTTLSKHLVNGKNRGTSSNEWIKRQIKDPYVEKAKQMNYRCRSAFKLLEINERSQVLRAGQCVVDLGAAPGSWTQVAVGMVNSKGDRKGVPQGMVIAVDRLPIYPIEGATIFGGLDFETEEAQQKIKDKLNNKKVDIVISDMAPNATGIRDIDQDKIIGLCYKALRFAAQVTKKDGDFLTKVWDGAEVPCLELDLGRFYKTVKVIKPNASRSESSEKFLLARGFKGLRE